MRGAEDGVKGGMGEGRGGLRRESEEKRVRGEVGREGGPTRRGGMIGVGRGGH